MLSFFSICLVANTLKETKWFFQYVNVNLWCLASTIMPEASENFIDDNKYDIIVMKQVLHHIVSREQVLKKLAGYLNPNGVIIIMTPNDGYQKSILPFNPITDLLGRIDDSMIYEYIKDLPLQVVEIQHVNSLATFNSLYEYFMFLYAIGSLQKIFNYKGEYEYALKLITVFKNLFSKEETLSVDFNYSYITLKKK